MNETILITGGAGFVGSQVAALLEKCGFHTITLDNLSLGERKNVKSQILVEADFGDKTVLNSLFSKYKIKAVCHLAALSDLRDSLLNPKEYYKENIQKTLSLLDVVLEQGKPPFLFSSSASVYGDKPPFSEETDCTPSTPYGKSKFFIEQILSDYQKAYSLRYFAFRYFNAAGKKGRQRGSSSDPKSAPSD